MTLAADLLAERDAAAIAEIARTVGYSDAFGFNSVQAHPRRPSQQVPAPHLPTGIRSPSS